MQIHFITTIKHPYSINQSYTHSKLILTTKNFIHRSESGSNYHAGHRRNESMYALTGLYAESGVNSGGEQTEGHDSSGEQPSSSGRLTCDTVIRCHSRNPSSGLVDHRSFTVNALSSSYSSQFTHTYSCDIYSHR